MTEGELPPALKKAIAAKKKAKNGKDEDDDPVGEEKKNIDEVKKGLRYKGAPAELRARQLLDRDKESMIVKNNKVIVIDKKDEGTYLKKGWSLAEKLGDKESIEEKIEYVEYKFKNKKEALAAKKFFDSQQRMGFMINDDNISNGELSVEVTDSQKKGDFDMTPYHNVIVKKLKPKVLKTEKLEESAIDDLRKIVDKKTMGKVSGQKVDLFSASAMVQVYDALNDKNKTKVEKMLSDKRGVMTFADFAMSQMK